MNTKDGHSSNQMSAENLVSDTDLLHLIVPMIPQVDLCVLHLLLGCKSVHVSHQGGCHHLPPVAPSSTIHGHTIPHDPISSPAAMGATWVGMRPSSKVMGSSYQSSIRSILAKISFFLKCCRGMGSFTAKIRTKRYTLSQSHGQTVNVKTIHSSTD